MRVSVTRLHFCRAGVTRSFPAAGTGGIAPPAAHPGIREVESCCGYPAWVSLRRMAVRPDREGIQEMNARPNIVLVHGAWAESQRCGRLLVPMSSPLSTSQTLTSDARSSNLPSPLYWADRQPTRRHVRRDTSTSLSDLGRSLQPVVVARSLGNRDRQ